MATKREYEGCKRILKKLAPIAELYATYGYLLPENKGKVMSLRFRTPRRGKVRTLAEVGRRLGLSRERARQIQVEAIKILIRFAQVSDKLTI